LPDIARRAVQLSFGQWSNPVKWLDVSTDNFGFLGIENEHTIGAANELCSIRKAQLMLRQVSARVCKNVARLGTATG
jgi:hypothetical protein